MKSKIRTPPPPTQYPPQPPPAPPVYYPGVAYPPAAAYPYPPPPVPYGYYPMYPPQYAVPGMYDPNYNYMPYRAEGDQVTTDALVQPQNPTEPVTETTRTFQETPPPKKQRFSEEDMTLEEKDESKSQPQKSLGALKSSDPPAKPSSPSTSSTE
eukprot:TRINITY_DN2906_c0_g1_i2.p2 TRINITY_DN2906_c0_g1~~TRINITY_DN2906_c0_g1_i2.p2  ORF type:complete len:154 (+),score=39.90 TRINITY_DN2906_c0_g1_i2:740-1201(+)